MSIFQNTISPIIAAQLKAREKIISQYGVSGKDKKGNDTYASGMAERGDTFLRFVTGKNSWVRMISGVNANFNGKIVKDANGHPVKDANGNIKKTYSYTGDQLAKKYILEGGTLFESAPDTFRLRSGIQEEGGIYGSNIDYTSNLKNKVSRDYGLRPMPGITSVNITNKSAYGSLREATIEYYVWDKHQLEEMEVLFMRTGYTVLLEWGWSQYIDHSPPSGLNKYPDIKGIKNFDSKTIDFFQQTDEDDIYSVIDTKINETKGNYDAMLGYIKNFSWQLMPNGGFKCTTVLISRGEVIENIKASSNPNVVLGSAAPERDDDNTPDKPIYSLFEKIFLSLKAVINDSEIVSDNSLMGKGELAVTGSDATDQTAIRNALTSTYHDIVSALGEDDFKYKIWYKDHVGGSTKWTFPDHGPGLLRPVKGELDGTALEYITMNNLVAILNRFFIARKKATSDPLAYIVIPNDTPCLMSEDTVSIDPTTCLVANQYATFITDSEGKTGDEKGFVPILYSGWTVTSDQTKYTLGSSYKPPEFSQKVVTGKYSDGTDFNRVSVGQIGLIYVSIYKILEIYRKLAGGENGVDITRFLTDLLDEISIALGGINDFKLWTTKNVIQIIDAKYLESSTDTNGKGSEKVEFDLIGLNSIFRDVKMNSRIYAEQSSMIGIAAGSQRQSGDNYDKRNLGDIYASTQYSLNEGLEDRIKNDLDISFEGSQVVDNDLKPDGVVLYYYNIYNNIVALSQYIKRKVLGTKLSATDTYKVTAIPQEKEIVNASSLLKTFHYQINGKDTDFKSLIPFELELTLDGIGGLVIGQIFKINKSLLPLTYYNKNLGFIITGITQNLQNNDWTTEIKTQICLLDNDEYEPAINKNDLKKVIAKIKEQATQNAWVPIAMTDFLLFLTKRYGTAGGDDYWVETTTQNTQWLPVNFRPVIISNSVGENMGFKNYIKNIWLPAAKTLKYTNLPDDVDKFGVYTSADFTTTTKFDFDTFDKFVYDKAQIDAEYKPITVPGAGKAANDNFNKLRRYPIVEKNCFFGKIWGSFDTAENEIATTYADDIENYLVYNLEGIGPLTRTVVALNQTSLWQAYSEAVKKWLTDNNQIQFYNFPTSNIVSANFPLNDGGTTFTDVFYIMGSKDVPDGANYKYASNLTNPPKPTYAFLGSNSVNEWLGFEKWRMTRDNRGISLQTIDKQTFGFYTYKHGSFKDIGLEDKPRYNGDHF